MESLMNSDDASGSTSWRTGCGYVVFSLLFFLVVAGLVALRPVRQAKRVEQNLNNRFGDARSFVPNPDGSVSPDRIETFLAVRGHLREPCGEFDKRHARLEEIGEMEETGEISWTDLVDGFKVSLGIGPGFLHLMKARNEGLTEEGMGIGEYTYIYVLAYNRRLSELAEESEEKQLFKARTREELTQILRNQLTSLKAGQERTDLDDLKSGLEEEISRLEAGDHAFPWQRRLPPHLAASFSPYRGLLDDSFCEATVRLELRQKNQHPSGLGK